MTQKIFSVWEGVFKSFEEAGGDFEAFNSELWIKKQVSKVSEALEKLDAGKSISDRAISKDYPLPLVVAMVLTQQEKLSILDFGGGMGFQYLDLLARVTRAKDKIDYCVVEGETTIKSLPDQIKKYSNLNFSKSLDDIKKKMDIVHIGSTLQYINDWKSLLQKLAQDYDPLYFVFSDLMAGDIPTFISHQICYNKKIPHRFYNLNDFRNHMNGLGFDLIFQSKFIHKILDQEDVFPNQALPETHRIDRAVNLVFFKR